MLGTDKQRTEGIKRQADELIEQAYQRGFKAGKVAWEEKTKDFFVEQGRHEAWETAKELVCMGYKKANEIVGDGVIEIVSTKEIFVRMTAAEAIKKLTDYKEEHKIIVGDEVKNIDGKTFVVAFVNERVCNGSNYLNGMWYQEDVSEVTKTGRHFDEIESVLKKLGETNG